MRSHAPSGSLAFLALFLALSGSAVALDGSNTVFSDDIVDGEVKTADLATGAATVQKLATNSVNGNKIIDGQVGAADIGNQAVGSAELAVDAVTKTRIDNNSINSAAVINGSILGLDVANDTLTGVQIDESTLAGVPSTPSGPAGGDLAATYPNPTIADTAVTIPKLAFDPATQPELDNLATDDGDPPNAGSNLLNWSRLVGVPDEIVDGDDVGWELGGNSATSGSDFLGTTDSQPLNLSVNNARALRLDPATDGANQSPNIIGGTASNSVTAGVHSATIGGGGRGVPANPATANRVTDSQGTVGGGANNQAGDGAGTTGDRTLATVGGGGNNTASGEIATVGGGFFNAASGSRATVAGGDNNVASGLRATVGGGLLNTAAGLRANVDGGQSNGASGTDATIGGGANGFASGLAATIPGGSQNEALGDYSLAGGRRARAGQNGAFVWADSNNFLFQSTAANQFSVRATGGTRLVSGVDGSGTITSGVEVPAGASALSTLGNGQPFEVRVNGARGLRIEPASDGTNQSPNVIGGAASNAVSGGVHSATIAGGGRGMPAQSNTANQVTDNQGTVGGGAWNQAGNGDEPEDSAAATVAGGFLNTASGEQATVGGGEQNQASGFSSTVGGGLANIASAESATVVGGAQNEASGARSTVVGGYFNHAEGAYSVAGGRFAQAVDDGAIVLADSNTAFFSSTAANEFSVRSTGGARFVSGIDGSGNPNAGVTLAPGAGSWSSLSDAASKRAIEPVSRRSVLRRLADVPISEWSYRAQDRSIRHIGPMAQDFYRAFGVGESRRRISSVDADGVALAAIQGLQRKLRAERRRRHEQERRLDGLEARLAALEGVD